MSLPSAARSARGAACASVLARVLAAAWLLAAIALPAAAQPDAWPLTLRDDRGVAHRFDRPPQRIVTLLPSLTEVVCALDACERLVGTDRYSDWPASVLALPKVGGIDDAVIERIVQLRPDVVLAASSTRANARLEKLGLKVLAFDSDRHEQVRAALLRLGVLLSTPAQAEAVWQHVQADLDAAAARVPAALRAQTVYFEADATPYAAGAASFVGQTLARLGLSNIAPERMGPFPKLNPEYIVRTQPQVVMAEARHIAEMPSRPGWGPLAAVRQGRVCAFDAATYEMIIRPGPRMGQAALAMADCLRRLPAPAGAMTSPPVSGAGRG